MDHSCKLWLTGRGGKLFDEEIIRAVDYIDNGPAGVRFGRPIKCTGTGNIISSTLFWTEDLIYPPYRRP